MADAASDIDMAPLEELIEIRREQAHIREFQGKAEEKKADVDPLVFQRVVDDYNKRHAALETRATPLKLRARQEYQKLRAKRDKTHATHEDARLAKQELEFRRTVGELSDVELTERLQAPEQTLATTSEELGALDALKSRFIEGFGSEAELEMPPPPKPAPPPPPKPAPAISSIPESPVQVAETQSGFGSSSGPGMSAGLGGGPGAGAAATPGSAASAPGASAMSGASGAPGSAASVIPTEPFSDRVGSLTSMGASRPGVSVSGGPGSASQGPGAPRSAAPGPAASAAASGSPAALASASGAPRAPAPPASAPAAPGSSASSAEPVVATRIVMDDEINATAVRTDLYATDQPPATVMVPVAVLVGPQNGDASGAAAMPHRLGSTTYIGRSEESNIRVQRPSVSRQHALISAGSTGFMIQDLHSQNGTYINGERIRDQAPLQDGDRVTLGDAEFVFQFVKSESPS